MPHALRPTSVTPTSVTATSVTPTRHPACDLAGLSPGLREAWRLFAYGLSYQQVAERMGLTCHGVRHYRRSLALHLGLSTALSLAVCYWALIHGAPDVAPEWYATLTPREREITDCFCTKGLGHKQVARELGISAETVHNHLSRVFCKARVYNLTALVCAYWGGEPLERRPVEERVAALDIITSRAPDWSAHMRYRTR